MRLAQTSRTILLILTCVFAVSSASDAQVQTTTSKKVRPSQEAAPVETFANQASIFAARSRVLKKAIAKVKNSIVHIEAQKKSENRAGDEKTVTEAGSGILFKYKNKNYILTNLHVVKESAPTRINVMLNGGRFFRPTTVKSDPASDIAILSVRADNLPPCPIGDSDKVEIGDFVFAVGSPFGLSHSVTYGFVSAIGRRNLDLGDADVLFQDFIQTDAAINPGNSGGPLLNISGEAIGINTAIASNSGGNDGIGFSIPINMAMRISKDLIDHGRVRRAFLGVLLSSEFDFEKARKIGMNRCCGALVTRVSSNSPALSAGLQVNDLILKFNNIEIENDAHLVNLVSFSPIGKRLPILIFRNRQQVQLYVTVRERGK